MKKILTILTLTFAFSLTSNAQEEKKIVSNEQINISENRTPEFIEKETKDNLVIQKDVEDLKNSVKMDENFAKKVSSLMFKRFEVLKTTVDTDQRKKIFNLYTQMILEKFSPDQLEMLKKNKELFIHLTEYSSK